MDVRSLCTGAIDKAGKLKYGINVRKSFWQFLLTCLAFSGQTQVPPAGPAGLRSNLSCSRKLECIQVFCESLRKLQVIVYCTRVSRIEQRFRRAAVEKPKRPPTRNFETGR